MTEYSGRSKGAIRPLTYIALAVSVTASAPAWFYFFGGGSELHESLSTWEELFVLPMVVILGGMTGIVLNVLGGLRGGKNQAICVVAGLILVAPVVAVVVAVASSAAST